MTARTATSSAVYVDGVQLQHANRPSRELCIMACVFCKDPQFHAWLDAIDDQRERRKAEGMHVDEAFAKAFILSACGVASRNDLDRDQAAAARFHDLVRKPFVEWKGEQFYAGPLGQPYGEGEPC